MKILVVDNEPLVRQGIVKMISRINWISEVHECNGVEDSLQHIQKQEPDVVLLDVEMDDGTGFDLLKQLKAYNFQLIFITSHSHYAIKAFQLSALDFVSKPVDEDYLIKALEKAREKIDSRKLSEQLEVMNQILGGLKFVDQKIVLRDNKSLYFVKVSDIYFCEAQGSYTAVHIHPNEKIVMSKSLKEYETMLEPYGFIRSHNSFLVNPSRIVRLDKSEGGSLILENGSAVPISQRKWDTILALLDK